MREVELKLRVGSSFRLPDLAGKPGVAELREYPARVLTVYFDTDDLRLIRWGSHARRGEDGDAQPLTAGERGHQVTQSFRLAEGVRDDAVAASLGNRMKVLAAAVGQMTDVLGDQHDAVVAQQTLESLTGETALDAATGYALGLLSAGEHEHKVRPAGGCDRCGPGWWRPTMR